MTRSRSTATFLSLLTRDTVLHQTSSVATSFHLQEMSRELNPEPKKNSIEECSPSFVHCVTHDSCSTCLIPLPGISHAAPWLTWKNNWFHADWVLKLMRLFSVTCGWRKHVFLWTIIWVRSRIRTVTKDNGFYKSDEGLVQVPRYSSNAKKRDPLTKKKTSFE